MQRHGPPEMKPQKEQSHRDCSLPPLADTKPLLRPTRWASALPVSLLNYINSFVFLGPDSPSILKSAHQDAAIPTLHCSRHLKTKPKALSRHGDPVHFRSVLFLGSSRTHCLNPPHLLIDAVSPLRVQTPSCCHLTQKKRWRRAVTQKVLPGPVQWTSGPIPCCHLPRTFLPTKQPCGCSDTPAPAQAFTSPVPPAWTTSVTQV